MLDRLPHVCPVCAYHEWNLDGLVEMAWEYLDLIRVYTKPKARTPQLTLRLCLLGQGGLRIEHRLVLCLDAYASAAKNSEAYDCCTTLQALT